MADMNILDLFLQASLFVKLIMLVLMGFSDSVGAVVKNTDLAMRRAKAVERELVSRGIAVMAVESYGELLPVANNDTDAGRERNRRVEVWVI